MPAGPLMPLELHDTADKPRLVTLLHDALECTLHWYISTRMSLECTATVSRRQHGGWGPGGVGE